MTVQALSSSRLLDPPPPRQIDQVTSNLSAYSKAFEDAQKVRIAATLRGDEYAAEVFRGVEDTLGKRLGKELKQHCLYCWLEQYKGLKGPRVGRLIAIIGDPNRFPGQQCSMGHTLPPIYQIGQPCPITAIETTSEPDAGGGGGEDFDPAEGHGETARWRGGVDVSTHPEGGVESGSRPGMGGVFDPVEVLGESEGRLGGVDVSTHAGRSSESEMSFGMGGVSSDDEVGKTDTSSVAGFPTGAGDALDESEELAACSGRMLAPRTGTGVASLWHYLGLHVKDGKLPMRRKGVQSDWNGAARTIILGPNGIAEQIIKQRTPKYRDLYDVTKVRIAERSPDLAPWRVDKIARTVAAKAFVGDLLIEWKRLVA